MQPYISLIFALCCAWPISAFAAQPPRPPEGWTDGYIMANGIRVHYWRTPVLQLQENGQADREKPVLLLAHGSSDDGLTWMNLAKELQQDYDIIMPDARGHGRTDPPSQSEPADVQAEDLAAIIRELQLSKPIVMGHSMGSASAAWFAAKYPDVPRAIVLEDPRLIPRKKNDPRLVTLDAVTQKRSAQILARNNTPYASLVADCIAKNPKWERSECEYWAPSKRMHHPNTAFTSLGDRPSMSELFPKITAPTLILKADAKPEVRKQEEAIAELLPAGKIVHIDGAGHSVRRDQKLLLLETLTNFLSALD